ncbi:uncharacterized protein LOC119615482 [Lucilia sericata]|uniref:uncharacterized protein LOC119615482 n=1 Tax=Lucilia sericata TaxID=13632 RepID=UPI0018A838DC|nr:uncharacterized protein LOC119615482 [Lucilia sericata]
MTRKFLQINLGRGREAQDLMMQKAAEDDIDIVLVSEPYGKISSLNWYEDISHRAAIIIRNKNVNVKEIDESNIGFVYATVDNVRIYSCYFSPNTCHEEFAAAIINLEESIRGARCKVLIGGDFNSKSPEWNCNILDNRGATVSEMIGSLGLTVFNEGQKYTFRRPPGGSIIDITFGTTNFYNDNMNWMVLEDFTLSNHQYITFCIDDNSALAQNDISLPKWNVRKLKEDKLVDYT